MSLPLFSTVCLHAANGYAQQHQQTEYRKRNDQLIAEQRTDQPVNTLIVPWLLYRPDEAEQGIGKADEGKQ